MGFKWNKGYLFSLKLIFCANWMIEYDKEEDDGGEKWISRDVKLVTCRREVITSPPPTGVPARQPWRKKWFFLSMNSIDVWNLASVIWMMYVHVDCRGDACSWFELEIKSTHVDIAKEAENYFYTLPLTLRSFILGCLIYIWSKGKCAFNTNWGSWVEAVEHFDWSLVLAPPPLTFEWNHDHSNLEHYIVHHATMIEIGVH